MEPTEPRSSINASYLRMDAWRFGRGGSLSTFLLFLLSRFLSSIKSPTTEMPSAASAIWSVDSRIFVVASLAFMRPCPRVDGVIMRPASREAAFPRRRVLRLLGVLARLDMAAVFVWGSAAVSKDSCKSLGVHERDCKGLPQNPAFC